MQHHVSLREVNQYLSRYIEAVQQGDEIIITRRGAPVARLLGIVPIKQLDPEQEAARRRSLERMRKGYALGGHCLNRTQLHER